MSGFLLYGLIIQFNAQSGSCWKINKTILHLEGLFQVALSQGNELLGQEIRNTSGKLQTTGQSSVFFSLPANRESLPIACSENTHDETRAAEAKAFFKKARLDRAEF